MKETLKKELRYPLFLFLLHCFSVMICQFERKIENRFRYTFIFSIFQSDSKMEKTTSISVFFENEKLTHRFYYQFLLLLLLLLPLILQRDFKPDSDSVLLTQCPCVSTLRTNEPGLRARIHFTVCA